MRHPERTEVIAQTITRVELLAFVAVAWKFVSFDYDVIDSAESNSRKRIHDAHFVGWCVRDTFTSAAAAFVTALVVAEAE